MQTQETIKREAQKALEELRTMAGEIRVQLHLASMDVKDKWNRELEPKLFSLEKNAERDASSVTRDAINELKGAFKSVRDSLARLRH